MRNSTLTAFYTPPAIVRALAEALRDAGVVPRRLLDPSAGAGIFPSSFRETADGEVEILSFEKDLLTGQVLSALAREREQVVIDGFQTIESAYDSYFDVVTSNIPFGDTRYFRRILSEERRPGSRTSAQGRSQLFLHQGSGYAPRRRHSGVRHLGGRHGRSRQRTRPPLSDGACAAGFRPCGYRTISLRSMPARKWPVILSSYRNRAKSGNLPPTSNASSIRPRSATEFT